MEKRNLRWKDWYSLAEGQVNSVSVAKCVRLPSVCVCEVCLPAVINFVNKVTEKKGKKRGKLCDISETFSDTTVTAEQAGRKPNSMLPCGYRSRLSHPTLLVLAYNFSEKSATPVLLLVN